MYLHVESLPDALPRSPMWGTTVLQRSSMTGEMVTSNADSALFPFSMLSGIIGALPEGARPFMF